MRKPTWLDLGIAVLGLFLVCSAAQGVAQTQATGTGAQYPSTEDTSIGNVTQDSRITGTSDAMGSGSGLVTNDTPQETGTGQTATGQGTGTQGTAVDAAQQRLEVARLRTEVARLEQQLAQMRARLSQAESASQATGGSGAGTGGSGAGTGGSGGTRGSGAGTGGSGPGVGEPSAEAAELGTGVGDTGAEGVGGGGGTTGRAPDTRPDTSNQGYAVVHVIHTGRVRSVSQQRLVLVDEGGVVKTLQLAPNVRVVRGGRQVSLQSLQEGAIVRASGDMYTRDNPVFEIQVVPTPAAER